jgi:Holliday junction DNA helicase RuvA
MIATLRGLLIAKHPPTLVVEAGGVGYELEAPLSTFLALPALGAEVQLHTHLVVRDDAHLLYGFGTEGERRLFRMLIKVNGVGPKLALAVLSGSSVDGFARLVAEGDLTQLTRLPGIGRKTAERLLVEMRGRLALDAEGVAAGPTGAAAEAESALVALGYKPTEAARMVRAVAAGEPASAEELIRRALQRALKG